MCVNEVGYPTNIGFLSWSRDQTTVSRCVLRGFILCRKPDNVTLTTGNPIPCGRLGAEKYTEPHKEAGTKKKIAQGPGVIAPESGSGRGK